MKRFLLILLLLIPCQILEVSVSSAGDDSRISALPLALQEQGRMLLSTDSEEKRAALAGALARNSPAECLDLLLSVLHQDDSPVVRRAIIHHLGRYPDSRVETALREVVSSGKEIDLAILALERLLGLSSLDLQKLTEMRLEAMPASAPERAQLAREQERYWCLAKNVVLPAWLRTPPPVFSVSTKPIVRVMAFGDYGDGGEDQRRVAKAMLRYHREKPVDLGITLGDNFQDYGADSPDDPRWLPRWQALYPALKIPFYPTLGNHDWAAPSGPAAAVLFSYKDRYWRMPATYYSFVAGPIQFFALDTNALSEAQLSWLDQGLEQSRARWKVVYGHHPVFSSGVHGDTPYLVERLLPLLSGRAAAYLCGHDHHMEHLQSAEGVQFLICGTGGRSLRPVTAGSRTVYAQSAWGFLILSATNDRLAFEFVDETQRPLYTLALR